MIFIIFHSEKNFIISGVCLSGVCLSGVCHGTGGRVVYSGIQGKEGLCILAYKERNGYVAWYTREGRTGCVSWYTREGRKGCVSWYTRKGRKDGVSWYTREGLNGCVSSYTRKGRIVYPGIQGKE